MLTPEIKPEPFGRRPQPSGGSDFDGEFFIDYSRLDDMQRQLIDRRVNNNMIVVGTAGAGKSLIALHKARQLATMGEDCAVIVFTKTLRKYFEDGLRRLGLENVYSYRDFVYEKGKVKYLIVDECQDFTSGEIEDMKRRGTYLLFFGDEAQTIMNFPNHPTMPMKNIISSFGVIADNLYRSYRLTKEIAALAIKVMPSEVQLEDKCVRNGERPRLLKADTFNGQLDRIVETIRNRSLTNVGILLPFNTKASGQAAGQAHMSVEYVKDYITGKGMPCEFKYNANQSTSMDLDFHTRNPKIMTWWCAKGLQFKDVFIPGCDEISDETKRAALYVAMTRSGEHLYLTYSGRLGQFFPAEESPLYFHSSNNDKI